MQANKGFKYLQCKCNRQQREIEGFDSLICKNKYIKERRKVEPAKSMKYKRTIYEFAGRRNSLSLCYGED